MDNAIGRKSPMLFYVKGVFLVRQTLKLSSRAAPRAVGWGSEGTQAGGGAFNFA